MGGRDGVFLWNKELTAHYKTFGFPKLSIALIMQPSGVTWLSLCGPVAIGVLGTGTKMLTVWLPPFLSVIKPFVSDPGILYLRPAATELASYLANLQIGYPSQLL